MLDCRGLETDLVFWCRAKVFVNGLLSVSSFISSSRSPTSTKHIIPQIRIDISASLSRGLALKFPLDQWTKGKKKFKKCWQPPWNGSNCFYWDICMLSCAVGSFESQKNWHLTSVIWTEPSSFETRNWFASMWYLTAGFQTWPRCSNMVDLF